MVRSRKGLKRFCVKCSKPGDQANFVLIGSIPERIIIVDTAGSGLALFGVTASEYPCCHNPSFVNLWNLVPSTSFLINFVVIKPR